MKAIRCHAYGKIDDLIYEDVGDPLPGEKEIIIDTLAIGANFPDGLLVQGLYQAKPETPFVPGMEAVGLVSALGSGVTKFETGDRVACIANMGAYAERLKCHQNNVMPVPENADPAEIVALPCGYGTAHHALRQRGVLKAGETLTVTGAAGLTGLAAVQIGKAMGAKVIAVASSDEKRALAKQNGADIAFGYENLKENLKEATDGKGSDVVFDVVGGEVFDACAGSMGWGGRLLVVGFASGTIPKLPVNLALVKGFSVVGVFWGSFTQRQPEIYGANMKELMSWYLEGKIKPHIEKTFALENTAQALNYIMDRKAMGKIVLTHSAEK